MTLPGGSANAVIVAVEPLGAGVCTVVFAVSSSDRFFDGLPVGPVEVTVLPKPQLLLSTQNAQLMAGGAVDTSTAFAKARSQIRGETKGAEPPSGLFNLPFSPIVRKR